MSSLWRTFDRSVTLIVSFSVSWDHRSSLGWCLRLRYNPVSAQPCRSYLWTSTAEITCTVCKENWPNKGFQGSKISDHSNLFVFWISLFCVCCSLWTPRAEVFGAREKRSQNLGARPRGMWISLCKSLRIWYVTWSRCFRYDNLHEGHQQLVSWLLHILSLLSV